MKTKQIKRRKVLKKIKRRKVIESKTSIIQKIKNVSKIWYVQVITLLALLGGIVDYFGFLSLLKTDKEIFISEKYIKGVLLPPKLNISNEVEFRCAGFSTFYSKQNLMAGIRYPIENASNIDLHFILQDNRVYTSLDFYSINDGEYIGKLNYKNWNLVKDNILNYFENDRYFEIIDNMNNVVFSLKYDYPNIFTIEGYQINKNSVYVFNEGSTYVIPLQNKELAISEIKKIKRLSNN